MDHQQPTHPDTPTSTDKLEDFLSLATHQLRSPLTTMSWTLDLLLKNLETEPPATLRHKLEVINHNTHTMIQLVSDMLTVAHLTQNRITEDPQLYLLAPLIQNILEKLKTVTDQKGISIELQFLQPKLNTTRYSVDQTLFQQCLYNVIHNAIKYSRHDGKVEIAISTENSQVCISVQDYGIGISTTDQAHIFEQFFRGQNVPNETDSGSGLGLFIVQAIVQRWRGHISVVSQENQGTTIKMCLPLATKTPM